MNILVLIPAHLLGAVIGLVCFRTVFPFLPNQVGQFLIFFSLAVNDNGVMLGV